MVCVCFKTYSLKNFQIYNIVNSSHHAVYYIPRTFSSSPTEAPSPLNTDSLRPASPRPRQTPFCECDSVSLGLTPLGTSCQWDDTVAVSLRLACFTQCNAFKVYPPYITCRNFIPCKRILRDLGIFRYHSKVNKMLSVIISPFLNKENFVCF